MSSSSSEEKDFFDRDSDDGEHDWKARSRDEHGLHTTKKEGYQKRNCLIILVVTLSLIFFVLVIGEIFLYHTHPQRSSPVERDTGHLNPKWVALVNDLLGSLNNSVNPCDDFYEYSCGSWFNNITIPSDKSYWSKGIDILQENNYMLIEKILTREDPPKSTINKFYASCLDTSLLDAVGIVPLYTTHPFFVQVDAWKSVEGDATALSETFAKDIAEFHRHGIFVFFSVGVRPSYDDPTRLVLEIGQVPLTLPTPDYYLLEVHASLRVIFVEHVSRVLRLLDTSGDHHVLALKVVELETFFAQDYLTLTEEGDPTRTNHPNLLFDLKDAAPDLKWETYFPSLKVELIWIDSMGMPNINVVSPNALKAVSTSVFKPLYESHLSRVFPLEALQAYVKYRIAATTNRYLTTELQTEFFHLRQQISKVAQEETRAKQCIDMTNSLLGEMVGASFVEEAFPTVAFEKVSAMLKFIKPTFEDSITQATWMDDVSKEMSTKKLLAVNYKIGFPEKWTNYSLLEPLIKQSSFFYNAMTATAFNFDLSIAGLPSPIGKDKWTRLPQDIEAYYEPSANDIVVPAGILQGRFFNPDQPNALNYGVIGSIIAHQLYHGFDDIGSRFDSGGSMTINWPVEVMEQYKKLVSCYVKQYSAYPGTDDPTGPFLNGNLTSRDNIADDVGIRTSFYAFQKWRSKDFLDEEKDIEITTNFNGLTNDQLFFIGWGQTWCTLYREEYLKERISLGPFVPAKWRTMGPLRNFGEFHRTFGCTPPVEQCRIL